MKSRESGSRNVRKTFKIAPRKEKKSSCYSFFWLGSICLVLVWLGFMIYSYRSSLLAQVKRDLPSINAVEINDNNLLRGIQSGVQLIEKGIDSKAQEQQQQQQGKQQHQQNGNNEPPAPSKAEPQGGPVLSAEYKTVGGGRKGDVHVIFSTDCSTFQDWQTLVMFHSAMVVGQQGPVTRIASGCTDEQQASLTALYEKLYPNHPFRAHYTPDWTKDGKTGKKYVFYNKPYGLEHWLEYAQPPIPDHTVVALLDPDMVLIRPITTQVRGLNSILHDRRLKPGDLQTVIERGHPVGQLYGLGAPWADDNHPKFNRTRICGEGSPCLLEEQKFAAQHYSVGPPYIVEKQDIWRIARSWTDFVPRVFEKYPYLLAEMYAYSMGAAHEKLPHLQLEHYMVSNTDVGIGEGWPHVDKMDDVCVPPDSSGIFYPGKEVPTVMHYCQFYRAAELGFQKRRVPKDIFNCDQPMLAEPPVDLGFTNYRVRNGVREDLKKVQVKRNAFALCIIHRSINAAVLHYRNIMCPVPFNTDKTVNVQKLNY